MSDLVRRDDLWAAFQQMEEVTRKSVRDMIRDAEAVDAVEVVRCKDCMYFSPWRHDRGDDSRCEYWNMEMDAEGYCSQAVYLNNGRENDGTDA